MENKYYHGLAGGIPFYQKEKVLEESLRTLRLIFVSKAIYCQRILRSRGIEIPDYKKSIYNGDDYISVCMSEPPLEDWNSFENMTLDSSFFIYARKKIAIELSSSIEQNCIFRKEPYRHLPAERQIYQAINVSDFSKILVGFEDENFKTRALKEIAEICLPYQIPVMTFEEAEQIENGPRRVLR